LHCGGLRYPYALAVTSGAAAAAADAATVSRWMAVDREESRLIPSPADKADGQTGKQTRTQVVRSFRYAGRLIDAVVRRRAGVGRSY
jgi:hypothetical protein